jgi:hypothetical protein
MTKSSEIVSLNPDDVERAVILPVDKVEVGDPVVGDKQGQAQVHHGALHQIHLDNIHTSILTLTAPKKEL